MFLKQLVTAIVTFAVLDFVWFGYITKNFVVKQLTGIANIQDGELQMFYPAAIPVYLLLAFSIVVFVIPKANESALHAALFGALMGLIIYGVFDFTNLAIIKNYPLLFVAADIAWGVFSCALTALITQKLVR